MSLATQYKIEDLNTLVHHQRGDTTYVDLDEFIAKGTGVCRHHASLMAAFAGKLVQDNLLPFSEVHIYRDPIKSGGAHQIVVINNKENTFILDSLTYQDPVNIPTNGDMQPKDREAYNQIMKDFGNDFAETAANRFKRKF